MHLFFSGVGGSGLAPLANLALDCGLQVSGSDISENQSLEELKKRGASVNTQQNVDFIQKVHRGNPISWFIYTSALDLKNSSEYQFIQSWNQQNPEKQIRISKRSELLNYILKKKQLKLLAVAGTHGKTTTTAMIVWLFKELNIPVSYSIGANISFGRAAAYEEGSEYFVYECDEFDRNFLDFQPYASVLTSLDYDHPDTYPKREDYLNAFSRFLNQSDKLIIAWQESLVELNFKKNFIALLKDKSKTKLDQLALIGVHNRENALLAVELLVNLNLSDEAKLSKLIGTFPGTQRRFEKIARHTFTDYAHHPKEIRATLQMATEYRTKTNLSNSKIVVIYQPHQNQRQHLIKKEYQDCFQAADMLFWLPTYLTREDPKQAVLTPSELISEISFSGHQQQADLNPELADKLTSLSRDQDIIIFLGAGTIDSWARNFASNLDK